MVQRATTLPYNTLMDAVRLGSFTATEVRTLIDEVALPCHFFVREDLGLEWLPAAAETIRWEIYQGRLLDPALTRKQREFLSWNVIRVEAGSRSAEPLLSVKLDIELAEVHVVRAILCHAWETYDSETNVIHSRETQKWIRELVGTVSLNECASLAELGNELRSLLFHAVVGLSKLPLTSVEAPLPEFSLGRLGYFHRPAAESCPVRNWRDFLVSALHPGLSWVEKAKLAELLLRCVDEHEVRDAGLFLAERWAALGGTKDQFLTLLRTIFNDVALSPYTAFVEHTLTLLAALEGAGFVQVADVVDFLGYLLRQLCRHLTAYDLVTFHHRGANYPDALFLDAVLTRYLQLAGRAPGLFLDRAGDGAPIEKSKRLRRRALRQACLVRKRYEGLLVPDEPTSPGENLRVLPGRDSRVTDEQILDPRQRKKRLYEGDALEQRVTAQSRAILRQSFADLQQSAELRELGTALFLDRPLGLAKAPGEPDCTPLVSYEAFSPSVALARLRLLSEEFAAFPQAGEFQELTQWLSATSEEGIPIRSLERGLRPGVVSLADAVLASPDFALLRTTPGSLRAFLELPPVAQLLATPGSGLPRLLLGAPGGLTLYDDALHPLARWTYDHSAGFVRRCALEFPRGGLRVSSL
jgi:hypothetical protein